MKVKKKYIVVLIILLFIIVGIFMYLNTYYKATVDVKECLKSSDLVEIKKDKNGYLLDGPGENQILVFYPGGKVEYTSYVPLMNQLAKQGIDTFIVNMPFHIAFFNMNAIEDVMKTYQYDNWYIGGHSLGGLVAAMDTKKNDIKGLVLLASYAIDRVDCNVLSIYGNNDGVLNFKEYEKNKKNIPNYSEIIIEGGNHSYFGNYGDQKGDKKATISREEQQERTVLEILHFIKKNEF